MTNNTIFESEQEQQEWLQEFLEEGKRIDDLMKQGNDEPEAVYQMLEERYRRMA